MPDLNAEDSAPALYADLSHYYDLLCQDIDYAAQSAFAVRLFEALADTDGRRLLDLACGTGAHLAHLAAAGFQPAGLDASAAMLAQARQRLPQAEWLHGDFLSLRAENRYHFITCFLYSLHYSHPWSSLVRTLAHIHRALVPGGVLLFDLADARGMGERDAVSSWQGSDEQLQFRTGWRRGEPGTMLLQVQIQRQARGQAPQWWRDEHRMTAVEAQQMELALQELGFEVFLLERDFDRILPWQGQSRNLLIAGRKPRSSREDSGASPARPLSE